MASPQTEKGFVMVALDLFPAIMSAGLSTYAQVVLAEIVLQSYGPLKLERVYLCATDIQERTGVARSNVRRAMRELAEANIVTVDGDAFTLNKDYETWTPKAGRFADRFGGRMLKWIEHTPERLRKSHRRVSNETQESPAGVSIETQETGGLCVYPDTPEAGEVCLSRHAQAVPPRPPIEERAREEELRVENREREEQIVVVSHARDDEPEFPDSKGTLLVVTGGPHTLSDHEGRHIWSLLWTEWQSRELCEGFYRRQKQHSAETWRSAISQAVTQAIPFQAIGYIEKIAGGIESKAKRKTEPESEPKAAGQKRQTQSDRMGERYDAILNGDYSFLRRA